MQRRGAEEKLLDYMMSEKFGLNWQKYDAVRMQYMIHIFACIRDKEYRDLKKQQHGVRKA